EPLRRLRRADLEGAQHVDDERLAHESNRSLGIFHRRPAEEREPPTEDGRAAAETGGGGGRRREEVAPRQAHDVLVMLGLLLRSMSGSGKQSWMPVSRP